MARAKVIHSDDAVMIKFEGNPKNPEPTTAVIEFPSGHVEVSRCSDGSYWAHIVVVDNKNIIDSRIDYEYNADEYNSVSDLPRGNEVKKIAIRISNNVIRENYA